MKQKVLLPALLASAGFLAGAWFVSTAQNSTASPETLTSAVRRLTEVPVNQGDWGRMWLHYVGQTAGTTNTLAAWAVIQPGQALHPAHRHAEEEFIVLVEGEGRWHLDGKEFPASKGDVQYLAPWVMHGLVNTGRTPLTFFVVKWNSKGLPLPPAPAGDHGK
jgi:mannose-6-phosphate isomerase-like protein (cupin superfamily)